jgi:hypothetical protein
MSRFQSLGKYFHRNRESLIDPPAGKIWDSGRPFGRLSRKNRGVSETRKRYCFEENGELHFGTLKSAPKVLLRWFKQANCLPESVPSEWLSTSWPTPGTGFSGLDQYIFIGQV